MISFVVRLSEKQHRYLAKVKREHGISMASQIRGMIQRDMGQGKTSAKRSRSARALRSGPPGYSACVRELNAVFEKRKEVFG